MENLSIHPRHWPKTGNGQKSHTCTKPQKRKATKAQRSLERRRIDCNATRERIKNSRATINPDMAFKMPGSFKK